MQRRTVDSSNVASVGHDPDSEILEVKFHNGGIYHYSGVPRAVYGEFMAADSKGTFLNARIKGTYPYKRVS